MNRQRYPVQKLSSEERVRVADLFKTGSGQQAERLVLEGKDQRDLGGWCRGAARDRILRVLEGTSE